LRRDGESSGGGGVIERKGIGRERREKGKGRGGGRRGVVEERAGKRGMVWGTSEAG